MERHSRGAERDREWHCNISVVSTTGIHLSSWLAISKGLVIQHSKIVVWQIYVHWTSANTTQSCDQRRPHWKPEALDTKCRSNMIRKRSPRLQCARRTRETKKESARRHSAKQKCLSYTSLGRNSRFEKTQGYLRGKAIIER